MADIKKIKPSLPKGTRDFLPEEVAKRNYIFDTIKKVFRKYGFQQIDTPAFERLETLTGKYGEEGDKLLFKILNSGDPFKDLTKDDAQTLLQLGNKFFETIKEEAITEAKKELADKFINDEEIPSNFIDEKVKQLNENIERGTKKIVQKIVEKGLRYDLTVPLARYVVQHNGDLTFPFKRFHIGSVWRADRPQKGRYQEFYQCDADVIGSTSLLNEVELTQIYSEVFKKLNLKVVIKCNHRKVLEAMVDYIGHRDDLISISTTIDKLDKIGHEKLVEELQTLGLSGDNIRIIVGLIFNRDIDAISKQFAEKNLDYGVNALTELIKLHQLADVPNAESDFSLVRGLGYYTGIIWEVGLDKNDSSNANITMGSIGGGGRYDNLTEMFGGRDMSGVGISFGIERIYDVMEELKLFPADLGETTKVLFVHFDEASEAYGFEQLQKVRAADIASEIYPGKKKLDKQMNYANDKNIPYVVVIGGDEMASGKLTFKNMADGQQEKLTIEEIIDRLKS